MQEFWGWLAGIVLSAGVVSGAGYVFRDTIVRFFSKTIEHSFEKRLEAFKGELRDNERELEQIRSFLVSARRDHDSALQSKRFEAAETMLRARQGLAQFSMLVEYMKVLKVDEILKAGDDPKMAEAMAVLINPFDVDETVKKLGAFDKTLFRLYLSDRSLKAFNAYESIVLNAVLTMKLFTIPLGNKPGLLKAGTLSKTVIELVPASKEGFDQFGESYAYHWATYFHDDILSSLRREVSGSDDREKAAKSAENLAIEARQAQMNVRANLQAAGLPEKLLKKDDVEETVAKKEASAT